MGVLPFAFTYNHLSTTECAGWTLKETHMLMGFKTNICFFLWFGGNLNCRMLDFEEKLEAQEGRAQGRPGS